MYGVYRSAPEGAELIEVHLSPKWVDLCWLDTKRGIPVYITSRPKL